jgi:branched-chain amino acid aminotransferase
MNANPEFAWLDGKVVPWDDARLHVSSQCVLGGLNAYEVIAGYWSDDAQEIRLFRVDEHLDRLWNSGKVMRLEERWSAEELASAATELVAANGLRQDVLVRIAWYLGAGPVFTHDPDEIETGVFMMATPYEAPAKSEGLHVCISGWGRLPDGAAPPRLKCGANYQNVRLAQIQAHVDGYDDALLVNAEGKVTEAPLSNVFAVRDGVILTPDVTSGILEGITRRTLLQCAEEWGVRIVERELHRSELYIADEVFLGGTGTDIWPVLSVDRFAVGTGRVGPLTARVREKFHGLVRGAEGHEEWLRPVYAGRPTLERAS